MTETSCCLTVTQSSSVPLGYPSSAYRPIVSSRHFHEAGTFKDSSVTICCVLQNVSRLFHESGTPKDHLTFRQVQQSSLCGFSCVQFIQQSRQEQFLPKWLTNSIRSLFDAHLPLKVDWCYQEQTCLIVMKSPKLLKH